MTIAIQALLAAFAASAAGVPITCQGEPAAIADYSITVGVVDDADGTGHIIDVICDADLSADMITHAPSCERCMAAIYAGYDAVSYDGVSDHVGDMVITLELLDDDGECAARYDYVAVCAAN